jgi:divalent metal cation (Fe/Co/Zn/Cd) transporter
VHPETPVLRVIREGKDPSIFTVVVEDSLALVGLAIAFFAVFLGHRLDNPYIDGAGSIVIGALLASAAFLLAVETRGLLLGEGVSPAMARDIDDIVRADPAVTEPGPALTMYLGPEEVLLNLEVAFEPGLTSGEIRAAVDRIEERLRERYPEITRVFIEVGSLRGADPVPAAPAAEAAGEQSAEPQDGRA